MSILPNLVFYLQRAGKAFRSYDTTVLFCLFPVADKMSRNFFIWCKGHFYRKGLL